jgi:hypothetical protein
MHASLGTTKNKALLFSIIVDKIVFCSEKYSISPKKGNVPAKNIPNGRFRNIEKNSTPSCFYDCHEIYRLIIL